MNVSQISEHFHDVKQRLSASGEPGQMAVAEALDELLFRFDLVALEEFAQRLRNLPVPRSAGAPINLARVAPLIAELQSIGDDHSAFVERIDRWSKPANRGGLTQPDFAALGRALGVSEIRLRDSKSLIRRHILSKRLDPSRVRRLSQRISEGGI